MPLMNLLKSQDDIRGVPDYPRIPFKIILTWDHLTVSEREFAATGRGAGAGEGREAVRERRGRRERGQPRRAQRGPGKPGPAHGRGVEPARDPPRGRLVPSFGRRQPRHELEPEPAALLVHAGRRSAGHAAATAAAVRRVPAVAGPRLVVRAIRGGGGGLRQPLRRRPLGPRRGSGCLVCDTRRQSLGLGG